MITRVAVVVPARDEEEMLPGCLSSIEAAAAVLRRARRETDVDVRVVLDGCTDGSAAVVALHGARATSCDLGRVGAARHLGVMTALGHGAAGQTWVACTDADSVVPVHWLTEQLDLADDGADVVVGTVEPLGIIDPAVLAGWAARHELVEGHTHVHGANLGLRATTYLALGGFAPLALHEDVDLVRRARLNPSVRVIATDRLRVRTSARTDSRCTGGFAGYLADLAKEVG